jgi:uncharacterized membrane protein YhaH (DUF805 family)
MEMFSFSGRANRMDYWLVSIGLSFLQVLITLLAGLMIGMLALSWLPPDQEQIAAGVFGLIVQLLFFWPITAVSVRRSHDRNMSGWWYGASALFVLGTVVVAVALQLLGVPEGENEALIFDALNLAQIAISLVFLVILGFLPGTPGTNRFGPSPNSRQENYRAPAVD